MQGAERLRHLPARHVIHAVGPVWHGGGRNEDALLASCYRRALEIGRDAGLVSIAFRPFRREFMVFRPSALRE
jgi:O-acetyl-ADP-ribose deacetylase (regulator of RNase III)